MSKPATVNRSDAIQGFINYPAKAAPKAPKASIRPLHQTTETIHKTYQQILRNLRHAPTEETSHGKLSSKDAAVLLSRFK
ncbi:hypothetical protein KA047_02905 [Candidatus Saccharibacteria bacterium]|nr:hypothetical protein [Candidatus Saccharibacteria bacterium]